jgi:hypothetical protein
MRHSSCCTNQALTGYVPVLIKVALSPILSVSVLCLCLCICLMSLNFHPVLLFLTHVFSLTYQVLLDLRSYQVIFVPHVSNLFSWVWLYCTVLCYPMLFLYRKSELFYHFKSFSVRGSFQVLIFQVFFVYVNYF